MFKKRRLEFGGWLGLVAIDLCWLGLAATCFVMAELFFFNGLTRNLHIFENVCIAGFATGFTWGLRLINTSISHDDVRTSAGLWRDRCRRFNRET